MKPRPNRRGAALAVALLTLMVVMLMTGAVLQALLAYRRQSLLLENELQAEWLAEAAAERALMKLAGDTNYRGEPLQVILDDNEPEKTPARVLSEIRPADGSAARQITVTALYPANSNRQVTVERVYTLPNANGGNTSRP